MKFLENYLRQKIPAKTVYFHQISDKTPMKLTIKATLFIASLISSSAYAGSEEELLDSNPELKKLVCLTTAASPVHRAPASYGCPGQNSRGGAKFEQSPAADPPGIRAIKNLYRTLRYELFGPVVVNRSSFASSDCGGHKEMAPFELQYRPGDYDKCIAALYFDINETKMGHVPMTTIYRCNRVLCGDETIKGINSFLEGEKKQFNTPLKQYLNCPQAEFEI